MFLSKNLDFEFRLGEKVTYLNFVIFIIVQRVSLDMWCMQ